LVAIVAIFLPITAITAGLLAITVAFARVAQEEGEGTMKDKCVRLLKRWWQKNRTLIIISAVLTSPFIGVVAWHSRSVPWYLWVPVWVSMIAITVFGARR